MPDLSSLTLPVLPLATGVVMPSSVSPMVSSTVKKSTSLSGAAKAAAFVIAVPADIDSASALD